MIPLGKFESIGVDGKAEEFYWFTTSKKVCPIFNIKN
jgi:hypothetical protein